MLPTIWFCLVALMLAMYVIFDGFDLGAGALHLWVARNDAERRSVIRSIGPVWDGNEVWLLAAGGTLYFAFPKLYASSFSGFYLPLMIVLWLLMLRAVSLELRNHIDNALWRQLWDVVFSGSSLLLVIFFGAALGNVVRGVPLNAEGHFFEPLWTNFGLGVDRGVLDWFTVLAGVAALLALLQHGALWLVLKTEGAVRERARAAARFSWFGVAAATALLTIAALGVQPQIWHNLTRWPWGFVFPALAIFGLVGTWLHRVRQQELRGFLASCVYLAGMLTSAAFGLYPLVLPAGPDPANSLTVEGTAAATYSLQVGLVWWPIGMALVTGYFVYTYSRFAGKVETEGRGGY
jgi:cytochrome d ubiquinol oxidase subunit II